MTCIASICIRICTLNQLLFSTCICINCSPLTQYLQRNTTKLSLFPMARPLLEEVAIPIPQVLTYEVGSESRENHSCKGWKAMVSKGKDTFLETNIFFQKQLGRWVSELPVPGGRCFLVPWRVADFLIPACFSASNKDMFESVKDQTLEEPSVYLLYTCFCFPELIFAKRKNVVLLINTHTSVYDL